MISDEIRSTGLDYSSGAADLDSDSPATSASRRWRPSSAAPNKPSERRCPAPCPTPQEPCAPATKTPAVRQPRFPRARGRGLAASSSRRDDDTAGGAGGGLRTFHGPSGCRPPRHRPQPFLPPDRVRRTARPRRSPPPDRRRSRRRRYRRGSRLLPQDSGQRATSPRHLTRPRQPPPPARCLQADWRLFHNVSTVARLHGVARKTARRWLLKARLLE